MSSEALYKASWEETGAAVPLQGPLVPAVLTLLVHKDNVTFLQLNLCLTLGRVRDHHAIPGGETDTTLGEPDSRLEDDCQVLLAMSLSLLTFPFPIWCNSYNLGLLPPLLKMSTLILTFTQPFHFLIKIKKSFPCRVLLEPDLCSWNISA